MDTISEPSELLLEADIISQEEKDEILASIDRDFLRPEDNIRELTKISSLSSGLKLPIIVGLFSVIFTLILLFIANGILFQNDSNPVLSRATVFSGSEWGVLKLYIEDSERILNTKNIEIDIYREEIVNYDIKISSLRDLLKIKEETEQRLFLEREKLVREGNTEEEIAAKLASLELSIISELNPDMISLFDSSIVELNEKINQILNDKTFSEKNLEESIAERKILVNENEIIQNEIESRQKEAPVPLEIITAMNKINEITLDHENEQYIRNQIVTLYTELFNNMDIGTYESAEDITFKLQDLIRNSILGSDISLTNQLKVQEKIVNILFKFIVLQKKSSNNTITELDQITLKLNELGIAVDNAERNINIGKIELAGNQIQTALSDFPEILRIISLLKEIDEKANPVSEIAEDKDIGVESNNNNSSESDAEKISPEENIDVNKMILLGKILEIKFDQITIIPISTIEVKLGARFYISKQNDQNADVVLGSGIISEILESEIKGKLETLFIFSSKPEINDSIYIKFSTN